MKLSACLVIHNEEKVLSRCLSGLRDIAGEIIIVHDGVCRDKSLVIAKKFNARIFVRKFVGEAEYHRVFAFSKAKGEWILNTDADEVLSPLLKKELPRLMESKTCDAYLFSWPYPDGSGYIKTGPFSRTVKPALFRKSRVFMIGLSHEYPRTYGKSCKRYDLRMDHNPLYDNFSFKAFKGKWVKWAEIQARQLKNLELLPVLNITATNHPQYKSLKSIYIHPLLTGLTESVKYLVIYFYRGVLFAGGRSIKIAIMELCYIWLLRYNIMKIKYGR